MAAAWIMAETGVGPSIASGSHVCSGHWAALPTVPMKKSSAISAAAEVPGPRTEGVVASRSRVSAFNRISLYVSVPVSEYR